MSRSLIDLANYALKTNEYDQYRIADDDPSIQKTQEAINPDPFQSISVNNSTFALGYILYYRCRFYIISIINKEPLQVSGCLQRTR